MAIVPNKDKVAPAYNDVHVYRPSEIASTKVATTVKLPPGNVSAIKPPVTPP